MNGNHRLLPLQKYKSWSPDSDREEVWIRRQGLHKERRSRLLPPLARSVTDEDLAELRGCIDLGFAFDPDSPVSDLSDTLPALDLYYAVHRRRSIDEPSSSPSSSSSASSPLSIYTPGESPQRVKAKLKQWAQVVACSVRQGL